PAEKAHRLKAGPHWGRRSLVGLAGGLVLILAGAAFWSFQPRDLAIAMLVGGLSVLAFAAFTFCVWLVRALRSSGRPWGRLLVLAVVFAWLVNFVAIEQRQLDWLPVLNGIEWALAIGLLVRLSWLVSRRASSEAEAARWNAGATGETIVSDALGLLEADHVVIHNLPIAGRGDVDVVVVVPAVVVAIETKY